MDMDKLLNEYAPGFDHLNKDEKQTIHCFSLLWTVFEAQVLDTNATANKILEKTKQWESGGKLEKKLFDNALFYFVNRYVDQSTGFTNNKFAALKLRGNDHPKLVSSVLTEGSKSNSEQLAACLIIVLRFRNNYFHGSKWAHEMRDQKDNFDHSIQLMKNCIDSFRNE